MLRSRFARLMALPLSGAALLLAAAVPHLLVGDEALSPVDTLCMQFARYRSLAQHAQPAPTFRAAAGSLELLLTLVETEALVVGNRSHERLPWLTTRRLEVGLHLASCRVRTAADGARMAELERRAQPALQYLQTTRR